MTEKNLKRTGKLRLTSWRVRYAFLLPILVFWWTLVFIETLVGYRIISSRFRNLPRSSILCLFTTSEVTLVLLKAAVVGFGG